jgi:uncharacterized protein (TIGR00369 family)
MEDLVSRLTGGGLARDRVETIPVWASIGVTAVERRPGGCTHALEPAAWLLDGGLPVPGALAVLADTTLGFAVADTLPPGHGLVTTHLHVELRSLPPRGRIVCQGRLRALDGDEGMASGELLDARGSVFGWCALRSLVFDASHRNGDTPAPVGAGDAGRPLALRTLEAGDRRVRLGATAEPRFANGVGNVHGGVGVLLGERAAAVAMGRMPSAAARARRLVELRAVYLRPLVADSGPLECCAEVVHHGRRLAAARAELARPGEPPAVLVDTAYGP